MPDYEALGARHPLDTARLFVAMTAGVALHELASGRRRTTLRDSLFDLEPGHRDVMGVSTESFMRGDVYIDYPYESVMVRYEKATGRKFRTFYGEAEVEVAQDSRLFDEARLDGTEVTRDVYEAGKPKR